MNTASGVNGPVDSQRCKVFGVVLVLVAAAVISTAAVVAVRSRRGAARDRAHADEAAAALVAESKSSAGDREVRGLILASMEEGVLLVDHEGERVFANEALERHLGDAPAKAELLLPTALRDAVRRAGYTGATVRVEVETGAPTRWLKASAQPVGPEGSVLLVVRDVTEARRLDAIRRDFVANASHELKTPVASIRATAETLRDGAIEDPPAARRFTEQLERDADRLARIVSDLLDLSRLETGSERTIGSRSIAIATDGWSAAAAKPRRRRSRSTMEAEHVPEIAGSARDLSLCSSQPRRQRDPLFSTAGSTVTSRCAPSRPGHPPRARTRASGSRSARSRASSNASTASTKRAREPPAAPGSGSRS